MDAFYKNLGFKKMDELDQSIELKSVQWTWRVTIILMVVVQFVVLGLMWNDSIPSDFALFPMFVISLQNSFMFGFRSFFRLKILDKGMSDYQSSMIAVIGNVVFCIAIISTMIIVVIRYL